MGSPERIRVGVSLDLDGYRLRASASVPAGAARPQELLPIFREFSKAVTDAVGAQAAEAGRSVSCRKGCNACCRLFVEVTPIEAVQLRDLIDALPEAKRRELLARFDSLRKRLEEAGLWQQLLEAGRLDEEAGRQLAIDYLGLQLDCPFLEDGCCSIYAERPLVCREYLVTSPAEECSRPLDGKVQLLPLPWSAWQRSLQMSRRGYGEGELVPLLAYREYFAERGDPQAGQSGVELFLRAFAGTELAEAEPAVAEGAPLAGPLDDAAAAGGRIVPDYEPPQALMVPHYGLERLDLLESIASEAARCVDVLLLTPDPARTRAFIARQPEPGRFAVVVAASDTAWIRDRAPFAVRGEQGAMRWVLPRLPRGERTHDARLFETICAHPTETTRLVLARGNLVAGPDGLAVSTADVLRENGVANTQALTEGARALGIRRWILFPSFEQEPTQHADVHLRFLAADLVAIAWNLSSAADRAIAEELEVQLRAALPELRCLRIPARSEGTRYASPLNWIQLGTELLVPSYELTPDEDKEQIRHELEAEGFQVCFLASPTLGTGGSLHCLTASIHL